jgi:F-type H+-transporting ATPase subunit delta
MADGSLSRRYARALIELGDTQQDRDRLVGDLQSFSQVLDTGDGSLRAALTNPGIPVDQRRGVLDAVLGRVDVHTYVKNFARLLLDKNRFTFLPGILAAAVEMADEQSGRVRAVVTTARDLDEGAMQTIQKALSSASGKHVIARFETNAHLIGGMVAKVGDTVYDASVRTRLMDIHQALTSSTDGGAAEA